MILKMTFSFVPLVIGLLFFLSPAFALKQGALCTLTIYEFVLNDDGGDGYSLGRSRILSQSRLSGINNFMNGSHPPVSYVARLQTDGSIKMTLNVKLDQYSDRSERTGFGDVQIEVDDVYGNFKDRYVLECKTRREPNSAKSIY